MIESCPNKLTYGSNLIISSIDVSNHHTSPPRVCIRLMTASASCLIPWLPFQHNAIKRSINIQKTKEHNPSVSVNLENNWLTQKKIMEHQETNCQIRRIVGQPTTLPIPAQLIQ
jgi:hypothetical protein